MRRPIILISRHSNDSLFSGCDAGMHYSRGKKRDVEGERGVEREGSEKRVREREREEGRQVVPHGVPRHPTMRGCGPPRVEREGERGTKRADGTRRKGVTEAVIGGEGICETRE